MAAAHSREVEAGKCELQHGADTQAGEADVASSESAESAEEYESMPCMGANIRPLHLFSAWCQNFLLWLLGLAKLPWEAGRSGRLQGHLECAAECSASRSLRAMGMV